MIKAKSIEPFPLYPDSIIDSKEKAIKVINSNYYYFVVMGIVSLVLGILVLLTLRNDREMIYLGVWASFSGTIYLSLSFIAKKFKSRIASISLFCFLAYSLTNDIVAQGIDVINFSFIVKLLLITASYRVTKASFYYNNNEKWGKNIKFLYYPKSWYLLI